MEGSTHKIASGTYSTAIVLDDRRVILTRHDGGSHRFVGSVDLAEKLTGSKLAPWAAGRNQNSDDAWSGRVTFEDHTLAKQEAISRKTYGDPNSPPELAEKLEDATDPALPPGDADPPAAPAKKTRARKK